MSPEEDAAKLATDSTFAKDLANYCADYIELSRMRSFNLPDMRPVETVMSAIKNYCASSSKKVAILFYFFEDDRLTISIITNNPNNNGILYSEVFALSPGDLAMQETKLKAALEIAEHTRSVSPRKRNVDKLSRAGRDNGQPQATKEDLPKAIKTLSDILFPDRIGAQLWHENIEHLVIVPSLNIQQIPFSVLQPFGDDTYLIDKWSYSIVPSVYDFVNRSDSPLTPNYFDTLRAHALIVGNPVFSVESEWVLPALPGAEAEVKSIVQMLKIDTGQLILGKAATIDVIREKVAKAKLLYFATHGIADPESPLDGSGLFFAPTEKDRIGLWTAREIQHLKLENCLVILSACQTGLGDPQDAGTIGLSRAFQLAGASHTIMSLWSVDDTSTMELMQKFVQYLQEGEGLFPCDPLRKAMLAYKQENPDPLHWASFSTFGIPKG